jgi:NADH-quinone oxidoreductase subunit I
MVITELMRGLSITLSHFFKKPVTLQYPEQRMQMFPRFRGLHELHRYANGLERCVCCGLCAAVCPADAIYMEAAENTTTERYSAGERYAKRYDIDMLRCIFCGYCEEACPEDAIFLGHNFELSDYSRDSFIYAKEQLLVPVGTTHSPGIVRGR